MSLLPIVSEVDVDGIVFPSSAKPPASTNILFLSGAGVRGLKVDGKFKKFTAIGVYLEPKAVPILAAKWKGKTAEELMESVEFFRDVVTGPFEKFTQVSFISPLTGVQYTGKVVENCFAYWNSTNGYTDAEAKAVEELLDIFKKEIFPPGSSIFFTHASNGSYTITFAKDFSIPEVGNAVIENKQLSETVLETIIGKNGVSPAARLSLASRLHELMMKEYGHDNDNNKMEESKAKD